MSRIIDAHHHLWDPGSAEYPWMSEAVAPIIRRFGPEDLAPLLATAGVDATIVVQARPSLEETRDLLAVAAATRWLVGVVGWFDLTDPELDSTIGRLRAGAGGDRLVGVRHQVHEEGDPEWLLRRDVGRGLDAVERAGLAYDLLVRSRELPAAIRVAADHEGLSFVLDHLAKPPIATSGWQPWAGLVGELAGHPNVACKLSGMVTEARSGGWGIADVRPYADHVLEVFGADRVLFGSDWPVCLLEAGYEGVVRLARELIADRSPSDQAAILGGNADRIYRPAGVA